MALAIAPQLGRVRPRASGGDVGPAGTTSTGGRDDDRLDGDDGRTFGSREYPTRDLVCDTSLEVCAFTGFKLGRN